MAHMLCLFWLEQVLLGIQTQEGPQHLELLGVGVGQPPGELALPLLEGSVEERELLLAELGAVAVEGPMLHLPVRRHVDGRVGSVRPGEGQRGEGGS